MAAPQQEARQSPWTAADVPPLEGQVAVVTGANTGVGFEAARVLAERGARVVLACRCAGRARAAADRIGLGAEVLELDLASLRSIRHAANQLRDRHPIVDLLINNAGVMDVPYGTTEDGFELHIGINHFGHFAFTGLVLPLLAGSDGARVVTVSSVAHKRGSIDFNDLAYEHSYKPSPAYGRSKLANLLFTIELDRRLAAAGQRTIALAAHPGLSHTELYRHESLPVRILLGVIEPIYFQSAAMGALPTLRAATDPAAARGAYYGPGGRKEYKGHPVVVEAVPAARDADVARQLWTVSEELTGVSYPLYLSPARSRRLLPHRW
jgi:NAD(P)-dependent dehydrogenase (short-subunit alcohol dehydrogenase family)